MSRHCRRCEELWRDYSDATARHVRLLKQQEDAAGSDMDRFRQLDSMVDATGADRASARAKIKLHMAIEHSVRELVQSVGSN